MENNIFYIGGFELPDKNAAAHRVKSVGKILNELGFKVRYIGITKESRIAQKNVDYISLPYPTKKIHWLKYWFSFSDIKQILDNQTNIRAIICYNLPSFIYYKVIKYCKKNNIKVIGDITEWYDDKRIIKYLDTEVRMNYLNYKVDGLICISSLLNNFYREKVKTILIPPLMVSYFKEKDLKFKNGIHLIYSGTIGINKDRLDYIIKSFVKANCNNLFLHVVGIDIETFNEVYDEKIIKDNNNIIFHGRVSHEESINLVLKSHFQLVIRDKTKANDAGFPTKFVESISCGTPVISTDISDIRKHVIEGDLGYIIENPDITDFDVFLKRISCLGEKEINSLINSCKKYKKFRIEEYLDNVESFVKEIDLIG